MIQRSTLTVESTEVIPTDSKSFKNISRITRTSYAKPKMGMIDGW